MANRLTKLTSELQEVKKLILENRTELAEIIKSIASIPGGNVFSPLSKEMEMLLKDTIKVNSEFSSLQKTLEGLQRTFSKKLTATTGAEGEYNPLQLPARTKRTPQTRFSRQEIIPLGAHARGAPADLREGWANLREKTSGSGKVGIQIKNEQGNWIHLGQAIANASKISEQYYSKSKTSSEEEATHLKAQAIFWEKVERAKKDALEDLPNSGMETEELGDVKKKAFGDANQIKQATSEFPEVVEILKKYDMTMDDVTNATREASTEIVTWTASKKNDMGITEQVRITTDKWGQSLVDTQKRFRSFGQAIARNIGEVFKWAIAAQLVWLPMRKLQEISGEMIELQTKLAAAAIATGTAFEESSKIFERAYKVAQETGSSVIGVVEGYELAYRAAGDVANASERTAIATKLLGDAMLLASITTMDEEKALDTLAGGLRQLDMDLDNSRGLLDSWVAVSKNAAVSIETLAESFAITSSSAENAGIGIDSLNAYVAVLAENTTLSATEVGNAFRAFVTGYQTDAARTELRNLGIAIENTKGEALDFNDVLAQIYQLQKAEIISPAQLNKLAVAIGGGNRRATQFITVLENLERVQGLTGVSASAAGDAEEALAEQMKTVTTALTKLENSFERFAQTLGTEGGFLSIIKLVADSLTVTLDTVSELTEIFGSAIPVITAFGVALASSGGSGIAGRKLDTFSAGAFNSLVGGLQSQSGKGPISNLLGGAGDALRDSPHAGKIASSIPAALSVGVQSIISAASGQKERGLGQVAGGAAGIGVGIAAGLGSGGVLIAAQVGSMIAGAIADSIWNYEADFTEFFGRAFKAATEDEPDKPTTDSELQELVEARNQLVEDMLDETPMRDWILKARYDVSNFAQGIIEGVTGAEIGFGDEFEDVTRTDIAVGQADPEKRDELVRLNEAINIRQGKGAGFEPAFTAQFFEDYGAALESATGKYKELLRAEAVSGELSSKQFKDKIDSIEGFDLNVASFANIAGDEFMKLNTSVGTTTDLIDTMYKLFYRGSNEQIQLLKAMTDEWYELNLQPEKNAEEMKELAGDAANLATGILSNITKNEIKFPVTLDVSKTFKSELSKLMEAAAVIDEEKFVASVAAGFNEGISYADWVASMDTWVAWFGTEGFQTINGVTTEAFKQAVEEGLDENVIKEKFSNLGLSDFGDSTFAEIQAAANQSILDDAAIKAKVPEYGGVIEDVLVKASDGWGVVSMNQELTNLILKDILDTSEKQLEGVYNLPANMKFYVPFTGNALTQGGAGGGGSIQSAIDALGDFQGNFGEGLEFYPDVQDVRLVEGALIYTEESQKEFNEGTSGKTLEDYFEKIGPAIPEFNPLDFKSYKEAPTLFSSSQSQYEEPYKPFQNLPDFNSLPEIFDNILSSISGEGKGETDAPIKSWLENLIINDIGENGLINEGQPIGVGVGVGGTLGLGDGGILSPEEIIEFLTKEVATWWEDVKGGIAGQAISSIGAAIKDAQMTEEEAFDVVIDASQLPKAVEPYSLGEEGGFIDKALKFLQDLFKPKEEETTFSGGGKVASMVVPGDAQIPQAGIGDALVGMVEAIQEGTLSTYFTSGQFHDDMMKDAPEAGENFNKIIEWLQGLEIFSPYGAGEEGGIIEQFRQLFQEAVSPTISLEIESNTQLTLDGRIVATSVKSYLADDLLAQETASGDITQSVVLA